MKSPMRIGLIADIHSNLPALEAVLDFCKKQQVEEIWNAGDFIGYGPFPREVVRRVQEEGTISILGNYDSKVLKFEKKSRKWKSKKHPLKLFAFQWASKQLTRDTRDYLGGLPEEKRLIRAGYKILIVHGSPESRSEHLVSHTAPERFKTLSLAAKADLIIFGHSHEPFAHKINQCWFINPGSVGRPDDCDYRASLAILEIHQENIEIHHYRIDYDLDKTIDAMIVNKFPSQFIQMVIQGKSLDAILAQNEGSQ